ncbi:MAG TPA: AMP-binding protein, partial [Polyangiaceae bacterium]|nr:AMP-binding protein [Polyangiaceae bacterium]
MARPTLEPALSEASLVGRLRALAAAPARGAVAEGAAAGGGVAVIDEHGVVDHGELWAESIALAARLGGPLGGRPVALLAPPGRGWVAAFFGILLAGGVVLPLSPLHPEAEVRYFVADSGARLALVDLDAFAERASWLEPARVVRLGGEASEGGGTEAEAAGAGLSPGGEAAGLA